MQEFSNTRGRGFLAVSVACAIAVSGSLAQATAIAPPKGGHPRIFLNPTAIKTLKATLGDPTSGAARAVATCKKVTAAGSGSTWYEAAISCGLAYQLTGDATMAANGIAMWRALMEDVTTLGDKKACVVGATDDQATASIKRDTGYYMRFVGPQAALAYDWLHDAPGAQPLLAQSRNCFRAWIQYYTSSGYLHSQPGSNYEAGFVSAKTYVAIAEAGEDGATSDKFWNEVVDDVFANDLIANGLAGDNGGVPRGGRHGALVGGDWPEGWQYGPLSVLEYALATRALEEQGVSLPAMRQWSSDLTLRAIYGMTPTRNGQYAGGDNGTPNVWVDVSSYPFMVANVGLAPDEVAGWGKQLLADKWPRTATSAGAVFDALNDIRDVKAANYADAKLPLWYLAQGTRNLYARSGWGTDAYWAVFTSAPRLVDDHQHPNASNFVFIRGADSLVVDPSPYGARGTLTGNGMTVDSNVVVGDYAPSQTLWSQADLVFARGTQSGLVAARGDLAKAFIFVAKPSDVPLARRDWVFLPEGEIVAIDRASVPMNNGFTYLRFRSQAPLALSASGPVVARGTIGSSALSIHAVVMSPPAAPTIIQTPKASECDGKAFGACTAARFPVTEYNVKIPGPNVLAVHVLDGTGKDEAAADVASLNAPPIDTAAGQNHQVVGASIFRSSKQTFVVAATNADGPGATMTYGVPGANPSRHVVFDVPVDATGKTTVSASASDGRCVISFATQGGLSMPGRPAIFTVGTATDKCKVSEDPDVAPGKVSPGSGGYTVPPGTPVPSGGSGQPSPGTGGKGTGGNGGTAGASGSKPKADGSAGGATRPDGGQALDGGAVSGGCAFAGVGRADPLGACCLLALVLGAVLRRRRPR